MSKRVIYKDETGVVCVLIPSPEALLNYTIEQIATKDVPAGLAYKIVDVTDIPADRTFRNAWTVEDSELTDGTGAE